MTGGALAIAGFRSEVEKINNKVKKIVLDWVQETAQISQKNFCPELTGLLKSTYRIVVIENSPDKMVVEISVGNDGEAPYAAYVHEIPYHHEHGQWKFLSTPFNQNTERLNFNLEQMKV